MRVGRRASSKYRLDGACSLGVGWEVGTCPDRILWTRQRTLPGIRRLLTRGDPDGVFLLTIGWSIGYCTHSHALRGLCAGPHGISRRREWNLAQRNPTSISYDAPPLVEVAMSVQFDPPKGLNLAHLGAFWMA